MEVEERGRREKRREEEKLLVSGAAELNIFALPCCLH